MSADPLWYLLQVQPQDCAKVKKAFNKAVKESKISQQLKEYLKSRKHRTPKFDQEFRQDMNQCIPDAFASSIGTDRYDWEDLHNTHHLFFPEEFEKLLESLFVKSDPIISSSRSEAEIDFIISNRVGASQMLYGGLGWSRANRLTGYCGNMFIPPEELKETLLTIEQIFAEVDEKEFLVRANAIGSRGNCNEDITQLIIQFPLALGKVLSEGNGFLALNFSDLGSLSFPDEEYDENY
jgi:hypothetical protein